MIAAPATPETYHLIDADALATIKPGAHIVNIAGVRSSTKTRCSRRSTTVASRAHRSIPSTPSRFLPGILSTRTPRFGSSAHVSWSAPDTLGPTLNLFAENVRRYRAGEEFHGIVDVEAGY